MIDCLRRLLFSLLRYIGLCRVPPALVYPTVYVESQLYLAPGAAAGMGTSSAPDPTKSPPTLEIAGGLKYGVTVQAFSADPTLAPGRADLISTQTAVKSYITGQTSALQAALANKATTNGAAGVNFTSANFSASAAAIATNLSAGAATAGRETLLVAGGLRVQGPVQALGAWSAPIMLDTSDPAYQSPVAPGDGYLVASLQANLPLSSAQLNLESPPSALRAALSVESGAGFAARVASTQLVSSAVVTVAISNDAAVYGVISPSATQVYPYFNVGGVWSAGAEFDAPGIMAFRTSLAMTESFLAVGNASVVYIYQRNGPAWNQTDTIDTSGTVGSALSARGSRLILGSITGAQNVLVYDIDASGKAHQIGQTLPPPGGYSPEENAFGSAVGIDGDWIVVGDSIANLGYVYTFDGAQWSLLGAPISCPNGSGQAADVCGNYCVFASASAGTATVCEINPTARTVRPVQSFSGTAYYFGCAVALRGPILAISGNGSVALYSINSGVITPLYSAASSVADAVWSAALSDSGLMLSTGSASMFGPPENHGIDVFNRVQNDAESFCLPVRQGDIYRAQLILSSGACTAALQFLPGGADATPTARKTT
jgi:hypothetical protein